jgi:hypothetical protein
VSLTLRSDASRCGSDTLGRINGTGSGERLALLSLSLVDYNFVTVRAANSLSQ